jgi:hypothetical protein
MRHERQLSHFFQPCLILILVLDLDFFQPTTLDASCLIVLSKYIMAYLNLYNITADTASDGTGTRDARIIWALTAVAGVWCVEAVWSTSRTPRVRVRGGAQASECTLCVCVVSLI